MLNGRRVDVRHSELALGAVDGEAFKKDGFYGLLWNHNYSIIFMKKIHFR